MKGARPNCGRWMRRLGAMVSLLLCGPLALWAGNCPFCYSKAASSSPGLLHALRSGILILMIPPALMSVAFTVVTYRRRNTFHSPR